MEGRVEKASLASVGPRKHALVKPVLFEEMISTQLQNEESGRQN